MGTADFQLSQADHRHRFRDFDLVAVMPSGTRWSDSRVLPSLCCARAKRHATPAIQMHTTLSSLTQFYSIGAGGCSPYLAS